MVKQDGAKDRFYIPAKFWEFYNSDLMVKLLNSAVFYLYAFIRLRKLENARKKNPVKLAKAAAEKESRMQRMGEHYARILLHCSNFENSKEDEKMFECIYHFAAAVLKLGISKDYWPTVDRELGFVFRGRQFNTYDHVADRSPRRGEAGRRSRYARRARGSRARKLLSITINARSPIISRLLPAPQDLVRTYGRLKPIAGEGAAGAGAAADGGGAGTSGRRKRRKKGDAVRAARPVPVPPLSTTPPVSVPPIRRFHHGRRKLVRSSRAS
eukprot:PLAT8033.1.p1 GENE.PLAT8033.1~~PLAT8033.1.p1  ORF type:complete len:269 (+),score=71.05 PLAT8033.1:298-1104(+)